MTIRNLILDPNAAVYTDDEIVGKINSATAQIARANAIAAAARPIGTGEIDNAILAAGAVKANLDAMIDAARGYVKTSPASGQFKIVFLERDATGRLKADYDDAANEHWAVSPELADVQAAIALASPGDTVRIPAGSATWASQLYYNKYIVLKAAGIGLTNIKAGWDAPSQTLGPDNFLIRYEESNPSADGPVRISGFTFDFDNRSEGLWISNQSFTVINNMRIDHNEFKNLPLYLARFLDFEGTVCGCVDHNIFRGSDAGSPYRLIDFYGRVNGDLGVGQWTYRTFNSGTSDNIYVENNDIYWPGLDFLGGGCGMRYCIRYNNWHYVYSGRYNLYVCEMHGNMGGGNLSGFGTVIYENTYDGDFATYNNPVTIGGQRGGKGLVYNNHFPYTVGSLSSMVQEEFNDSLDPPANNVISGQPQHLSDYYVFNNDINGVAQINSNLPYVASTINYGGGIGIVPRNDVHFWRHVASFDGSTGIGVGLQTSRPESCSLEGAAYWATDESKLYRWHSGAWEIYYTPYTYPHPNQTNLVVGD